MKSNTTNHDQRPRSCTHGGALECLKTLPMYFLSVVVSSGVALQTLSWRWDVRALWCSQHTLELSGFAAVRQKNTQVLPVSVGQAVWPLSEETFTNLRSRSFFRTFQRSWI